MKRPPSRPKRWAKICTTLEAAVEEMESQRQLVQDLFEELRDVQSEYAEWRDSMPENLADSPMGEKVNAVADLDLEPDDNDIIAMRDALDEAINVELPRGFGKD